MTRFINLWIVTIVATCGILLAAPQAFAAEAPVTLAIGSPAPDFTLPGVDGRDHSLKDFAAARILAIVFTCNHCPTAQYYEERIKQLAADYKNKGVALVAISPNDPKSVRLDELGWTDLGDSFEEMKIRAKDRQFNFPYLYDGDTETVSRLYGPVATPHIFIFDSARKLQYVGRIDDSELPQHVKVRYARDAIEALLAGKEPPVTKTKAAGCSVKWAGKADTVKAYLAKLAAETVTVAPADADALKDLRKGNPGKVRLVSFWATWCAPCLAEFNELVTIHRMYRHRDLELVTVALNRPEETSSVLKVLQKEQASCRNLIFASPDRDKLIDAFDPGWQGAVPYTVLIAPDGKILYKKTDSIDPLELRRAIQKALNDKKPWK